MLGLGHVTVDDEKSTRCPSMDTRRMPRLSSMPVTFVRSCRRSSLIRRPDDLGRGHRVAYETVRGRTRGFARRSDAGRGRKSAGVFKPGKLYASVTTDSLADGYDVQAASRLCNGKQLSVGGDESRQTSTSMERQCRSQVDSIERAKIVRQSVSRKERRCAGQSACSNCGDLKPTAGNIGLEQRRHRPIVADA